MKVFKWIILLLVVSAAGWVSWKWYNARGISEEAMHLIPHDAVYCISIDDPVSSWNSISNSGMWKYLQTSKYFASLTKSINNLDSLLKKNDLLFELVGSRPLLASAHLISSKDYDFLFLADLKEISGIKFVNEYLSAFSAYGFSVKKEKYMEEDILVLHDPKDKSNLYISFPGTYLVASYTKQIIISALNSHSSSESASQKVFMEDESISLDHGIFKVYLNYTMLPQLARCYSDVRYDQVERLSKILISSTLKFSFDDGLLKAEGITMVNDSIESYVKTLAVSGKSGMEFLEISPQRVAFCLGLGFSSFNEFFENFQNNIKEDVAEYNEYAKNLGRIEDYLKLNVKRNITNWIGDEVALLELQSSGGIDNEVALILKANNIENAKIQLEHIEKMIRKRTPVKFKSVDHHGYSIKYLGMKGLFKILFGKFFERYDKPYYTIVNNFVIFSNHPQTLKSIIDDYLAKNTLERSEEFRNFRRQFKDEGSVFIYLHTPIFYNTLSKLVDKPTKVSMEENKKYITSFRHFGFQLIPSSGGFKTIFADQFVEPKEITVESNEVEITTEIEPEEEIDVPSPLSDDPMELPYIYIQNLNGKSYKGYYPDSTLHYIVEIRNGFKDGSYTEYHQNGEVKMTGKFKEDKRDGSWRLYNEGGKMVMKRTYDMDKIKREKN